MWKVLYINFMGRIVMQPNNDATIAELTALQGELEHLIDNGLPQLIDGENVLKKTQI